MKISGLKPLTRDALEARAKDLLELYDPSFFSIIRPTPLKEICTFLKEKHGIDFNFNARLGFNSKNDRLLGICNPRKGVIMIDESIENELTKFNFTLAHELGHLRLHRDVKVEKTTSEDDQDDIRDTEAELSGAKRKLTTPNEWMEWQANNYAASLLMPEINIKSSLLNVKSELGLRSQLKIYVDDQPCNLKDFNNTVALLCEFYQVSKSAIQYRLDNLGLVDDNRKKPTTLRQGVEDWLKKMQS